MSNRFYTILLIPEKTSAVRRLILPGWAFKGFFIGLFFAVSIAFMMILNYSYVMSQIGENKELKLENRKLRQQVQVFKNKISVVESTMERIKTFSTRLKVITHIEDRENQLQSLIQKLPDAATNVGHAPPPSPLENTALASEEELPQIPELESQFSLLNHETLQMEQTLQDQYELLADKKSFLAALPTRKPAIGYFTSGFGVRRSPYGGREKMHEGLDIANHVGTIIKAPADGVVTFAEIKPGYGQTLILDHGYGLETWYAHSRKLLAKKGQKVLRGEKIALLGNSGRSTGPHLHYEVRVHGTPVDPLSYILEN